MEFTPEYIEKVLGKLGKIIAYQMYLEVSDSISGDVGAKYVDKGPTGKDYLNMRKGTLMQSFIPGKAYNLTKIQVSNGKLEVEQGSSLNYAAIHEYGGNINAKAAGKGRAKTKMEAFFWNRYKETAIDYYKGIALKIRKVGYVTIPGRKYFSKAV